MRALVCHEYGPFENLRVENIDDPVLKDHEVLIDVHAAGMNFPDMLLVRGDYQAKPELPFVAGGECAGTVSAVGPDVKHYKEGDPVIGMSLLGAFAEKMAVPESGVVSIPQGMSFEHAAGISVTYATSYYALKQVAQLQANETVVVLGAAGGVGLAAVEIAKAMGARVIAAASTEEKLDAACDAGADERINYSVEPLKDRIKTLTKKKGADVIYDPVGGDLAEQALRATGWNGRFLVVGFASGDIPRIPLNLPLLKSCSIAGVFWGSWSQRFPKESMTNFNELKTMFEDGKLKPRVKTFPLTDYVAAFQEIAERRVVGKVVLTMGAA